MKFKFVPRRLEERIHFKEISWWNKLEERTRKMYCKHFLIDYNNVTEKEIKNIHLSITRKPDFSRIKDLYEVKRWGLTMYETWGSEKWNEIKKEKKRF